MGIPICKKCNSKSDDKIDEIIFSSRYNKKIYSQNEIQKAKQNLENNLIQQGAIFIKNENIIDLLEKNNPLSNKIMIPPEVMETISQSYLIGPFVQFQNGEYYEGGWDFNYHRYGFGICLDQYGNVFKGLWSNNKFGKYGAFIESNGNYYMGQFNNGKEEGKGEMLINRKMKYKGEFYNDLPNGHGILENYIDNSIYTGQLVNGVKEGYGEIKYKDGTIYKGEFKNDKYNGRGKIKFPNGREYEGEFRDNKIEGKGIYRWEDGKYYNGSYVDNVKQGYGILYWSPYKYYEGNWANNKQHGEGTYHHYDKALKVKFRFGKLIMKKEEIQK